MKVREVCAAIEEWAPAGLAHEGDRAGLRIGEPDARVSSVLVTLTVTRGAFRATRRAKAGLIISHHPVLWNPLEVLRTDDPETRLYLDLVQANIACFAAHTNLDVASGGVNDVLADKLGLIQTSPLLSPPQASQVKLVAFVPETHLAAVRQAVSEAGAGVIGEYTHCSFSSPGIGTFLPGTKAKPFSGRQHTVNEEPELRFETLVPKARLAQVLDALMEAHPYEEVAYDVVCLENRDPAIGLGIRGRLPSPATLDAFAKAVRDALKVSHVRMVGNPRKRISRVAVLGGAGGDEVRALPTDLDVFVTGDLTYHVALAAQARGLALIDAGHLGTEKWIVPVIARFLRKRFKTLRVSTHMEPETFRTVTG